MHSHKKLTVLSLLHTATQGNTHTHTFRFTPKSKYTLAYACILPHEDKHTHMHK